MLAEQEKLLGQIRAAEKAATDLYKRGVKLMSTVQNLRSVGDDLESRIRFIKRHDKGTVAQKPKPPRAKQETTTAQGGKPDTAD